MKITWRGDVGDSYDWRVGDAFYNDDYPRHIISAAHAGKRPIVVCLPGRVYFCIYSQQSKDGKPFEPGWSVSGEPENLTLAPSVNMERKIQRIPWGPGGESRPLTRNEVS